jgi:transcriptional regulator with XRE-family HTH domain
MMHFDGRPITYYLKSYRRHAHLSQAELAYLLGASTGAMVSRYEGGSRTPSLQTGLAYEAALGEPVSKLFRGSYEEIQAKVAKRRRHLVIEEKRQGASVGSVAHHAS